MISELLKYLTSQCGIRARNLGYLRESIAIESRFRRVAHAWAPHIQKTSEAIMLASEQCQHKNSVVILGAGSLIDVPLTYLAKTFQHVYLVDIVITLKSRLKALRYRNVSFHLSDLSGFKISRHSDKVNDYQPDLAIVDLPHNISQPDLCISVNMLTQLPILPRQYMEKRLNMSDKELNAVCLEIINNHLLLLNKLKTNICLITDSQYDIYDLNNAILATDDMLYGYNLGLPLQQWTWDLAPPGEINPNYGVRAQVAYHSWDSSKNI